MFVKKLVFEIPEKTTSKGFSLMRNVKIRAMCMIFSFFLLFPLGCCFAEKQLQEQGWENGFYETYASLESKYGSYEEWPSEAKEELIPFFSATTTDQLDKLLAKKYGYGRIDVVSFYSVVVGDHHAIPIFWDEESRLRYSELQLKYGLARGGWIDVHRDGTTMAPDEAINLAKTYVVQIGLSASEDIEKYRCYWSYGRFADQRDSCYEIHIYEEDDELLKSCYVFDDHTVSETYEGEVLRTGAWVDERIISMTSDYAAANKDIPPNASFAGWPLSAKAYFSENMAPMIRENAYGRSDFYSPAELLAAAQYVYGLPDDASISQQDAMRIAQQELMETYHLSPEMIDHVLDACVYYDVTDQKKPLWKLLFVCTPSKIPDNENEINIYIMYKVHIEAYHGKIVHSYAWNYREDNHEWRKLMKRY